MKILPATGSTAVGSSFSAGGSCVDGLPDFEGEGHPAIGVDGDVVQQACPEAFPEGGDLAVLLLQEFQGILYLSLPGLLVADLPGDFFVLGLGSVKPAAQGIEALLVLGLILRERCVLPDAVLHHLRDDLHLAVQVGLLRQEACQVEDRGLCLLVAADGLLPPGQQDVGGGDEPGTDFFLGQKRRGAALLVFVLLVALPDHALVRIGGVPVLGAVPAATVAALDLGRKLPTNFWPHVAGYTGEAKKEIDTSRDNRDSV